jgi:phage repressor protein C with HTH and peptisase S24 domain
MALSKTEILTNVHSEYRDAAQTDTNTLSHRLRYAMRLYSMSQSELARKIGVKPQVIQYLCTGNIKSSRFTYEIADALNINHSWLAAGEGEMVATAQPQAESYKICLIDWDKLDDIFEQKKEINLFYEKNNYLLANVENPNSCFALQLNEKSMEPRFDQGTFLIFNTQIEAHENDFVLAKISRSNTWLFRQFKNINNKKTLAPINKDIFNTIPLEESDKVFAVMVQTICNYKKV